MSVCLFEKVKKNYIKIIKGVPEDNALVLYNGDVRGFLPK